MIEWQATIHRPRIEFGVHDHGLVMLLQILKSS
jgi:hypothetical protein